MLSLSTDMRMVPAMATCRIQNNAMASCALRRHRQLQARILKRESMEIVEASGFGASDSKNGPGIYASTRGRRQIK